MTQIVSDRDHRRGDSNKGGERGDFKYQVNGQESVCPAHAHLCVGLFVCACVWIVELRTGFHGYCHKILCTRV
jgi:hypothetical protein